MVIHGELENICKNIKQFKIVFMADRILKQVNKYKRRIENCQVQIDP